ncbi:MAG: pre-peptidase C-terminal domain-containing protein [Sterolibacterium sp.]|jgi:hypothetical protein
MTTFKSTATGEALLGSKSDDELLGFAGNDTLTGGQGDDYLDGGTDNDTAEYTGLVTEYTFDYDEKSGTFTITDSVADRDGIDTVIDVEVYNFGKASKTLAELIALATGVVADDYAADSSTTGLITVGTSASGNLEEVGDEDWFALTLLAGQSYTFSLDAAATAGLSNPKLWLYTGKGAVLDSNDNANGSSLNSQISYTATTSGKYYLGATGVDTGTGAYRLSATTTGTATNNAPTGSVTITGAATQGQTLTASNTLTDLDGLGTISYQWNSAGTAISGATASTFALTESQVGKAITVTASYTDGHGTAETITSSSSLLVANVNDASTGSVTISGTPTQNQTLTAANTLADADGIGTISYQWQINTGSTWTNLTTGNNLTLAEAHVGKSVRVIASYTDGHGTVESASSTATQNIETTSQSTSGNDTFIGGVGTIDGGGGIDTVQYSGSKVTPIHNANGSYTVGTDILINVERIQFSDTKVALDMGVAQPGGEAGLLIGAVVGKAFLADKALVGTLLTYFDAGNSMHDAADFLVTAGIMDALAGGSSTNAYVNMIYQAVTGQVATPDITVQLAAKIDGVSYTKADFLTEYANLPMNQTNVNLVGLQQTGLGYS